MEYGQADLMPIDNSCTNVWGLPEVVLGGQRYVVWGYYSDGSRMVEDHHHTLTEEMGHCLRTATWDGVPWASHNPDEGALGFLFGLTCSSLQTTRHGPRVNNGLHGERWISANREEYTALRRELQCAANNPGRVIAGIQLLRQKLIGEAFFRQPREMRLEAIDGVLRYTRSSGHTLDWDGSGTLRAVFASLGSHQFLLRLMSRFGLSNEILKPQ